MVKGKNTRFIKICKKIQLSKTGNKILSDQILDLSTKLSVRTKIPFILELT